MSNKIYNLDKVIPKKEFITYEDVEHEIKPLTVSFQTEMFIKHDELVKGEITEIVFYRWVLMMVCPTIIESMSSMYEEQVHELFNIINQIIFKKKT